MLDTGVMILHLVAAGNMDVDDGRLVRIISDGTGALI